MHNNSADNACQGMDNGDRRYQIYLCNEEEPIDVYVISHNTDAVTSEDWVSMPPPSPQSVHSQV